MIVLFVASVFLVIAVLFVPAPAEAYLLPLIGAGGTIITMLIGVFAALCAALFLVFYNVRRALRRFLKKPDAKNETPDDDTANPSDH